MSSYGLRQIVMASDLEQVEQLTDWFAQFRHAPLPDQLWIEAQLGLVEAFTNAVRHAHRDLDPPMPVHVEVQIAATSFALRVIDYGPAYDLEAALQAIQAVNPLEREAHWGQILLMNLTTQRGWDLHYRRQPSGVNVFELSHGLAVAIEP